MNYENSDPKRLQNSPYQQQRQVPSRSGSSEVKPQLHTPVPPQPQVPSGLATTFHPPQYIQSGYQLHHPIMIQHTQPVYQVQFPHNHPQTHPHVVTQQPFAYDYSRGYPTNNNNFTPPVVYNTSQQPPPPLMIPQQMYHLPPSQASPVSQQESKSPQSTKSKSRKSPTSSPEDQEFKKKRKRLSISCTTCRKRKIKCDRRRPICGSCAKNNVPIHLCIYDDSPWVSSLVKEQTLQTEIESLIEQRQKLKDSVNERNAEISDLKIKLDKLNSKQTKNISINSLINTEEVEAENPLDFTKFYTFKDAECNGLFTLQNLIGLTPCIIAKEEIPLNKQNYFRKYKDYSIDDLIHDLPSFKRIESTFQYIFDINIDHNFQFMGIFKDPLEIKGIFYKVFNKKNKINYSHMDNLELCYCLLILKFGMMFGVDEDFPQDIDILSTCYNMLMEELLHGSATLFLLENFILFNNLVNLIAPTVDESDLSIPLTINMLVNKLLLQYKSKDKKLLFTILYQDYFVSLKNGTPLLIDDVKNPDVIDDDNFDDIIWSAMVMIRRVHSNCLLSSQSVSESDLQITQFYMSHIMKFDTKFYLNFHIRTIKSGINKDKRLILTLVCLDLVIDLKFFHYLSSKDPALVEFLIFVFILIHWIIDEILHQESFSKNRCLQISMIPMIKTLLPKLMTILLHFTTQQTPKDDSDINLWELAIHELEKLILSNIAPTTSNFQFDSYYKVVKSIYANTKKIDLFNRDPAWMLQIEKLLDITDVQRNV